VIKILKQKIIKTLENIIKTGTKIERKNKFTIYSLYNYSLELKNNELKEIENLLSEPKKYKLEQELILFLEGETNINIYQHKNIQWWNNIGKKFINSYPNSFKYFNNLKEKIEQNNNSKNNILYIGNNETSNFQPCLNLLHFQKLDNKLIIGAYQRSCDANLGFIADLFHIHLLSKYLNFGQTQLNILYGNIHIYENNIDKSIKLINEYLLNDKIDLTKYIFNYNDTKK